MNPLGQDSISRSEGDNLYSDIRFGRNGYGAGQARDSVQPINKPDRIEQPTNEKLEREALNQFQLHSGQNGNNPFIFLVHVGQFLFLFVMLPPYFMFYSVPRWLFMEMVPECVRGMISAYNYIERGVSHLVALVSRQIERVEAKIDSAVDAIGDWISASLKKLVEPLQPVFSFVARAAMQTSRTVKAVVEFPSQIIEKVHSFFAKIGAKISESVSESLSALWDRFEAIRKFPDRFIDRLSDVGERLKSMVLSFTQHVGNATQFAWNLIPNVIEYFSKSKEKENTAKTLFERLTDYVKTIGEKTGKMVETVSSLVIPIVHKIAETADAIYQRAATFCHDVNHLISRLANPVIQWIGHHIESAQNYVIQTAQPIFESILLPIWRRLVSENALWRRVAGRCISIFGVAISRFIAPLKHCGYVIAHVFNRLSEEIANGIKERFERAKQYAKRQLQRGKVAAVNWAQASYRKLRAFARWLHLFFIMLGLILRFGGKVLRELLSIASQKARSRILSQ